MAAAAGGAVGDALRRRCCGRGRDREGDATRRRTIVASAISNPLRLRRRRPARSRRSRRWVSTSTTRGGRWVCAGTTWRRPPTRCSRTRGDAQTRGRLRSRRKIDSTVNFNRDRVLVEELRDSREERGARFAKVPLQRQPRDRPVRRLRARRARTPAARAPPDAMPPRPRRVAKTPARASVRRQRLPLRGRARGGLREESLPLLVLGNLGAHHVEPSLALDDPAVLAELLDGGADLRRSGGRA